MHRVSKCGTCWLVPGQVGTPILEQVFDEETKRQFESLIPRGKMGRPEEIATVALSCFRRLQLRKWGGVVC
jgi:NAD(P)-dependent dehydrogenase (short-subunit alcohol dehydrogenase family)